MRSSFFAVLLVALGGAAAAVQRPAETDLPLDQLRLPEGFEVSIYADSVANARQMALSPGGTLFIGTRRLGNVYAAVDQDGDQYAETIYLIDDSLAMPSGLAFHDGDLYVAATGTIYRYNDIDSHLANPPEPDTVVDDLPDDRWHGWKFIAFGPDGKLYVPVGAPCNVCDREDPYATILRMNPDGSEREVFARGVRNSVGFDWHPQTGLFFFTDNGRDNISPDAAVTDNLPSCELNRADEAGLHFGFPYVHQGDVLDPEFGEGHDPADYVPPVTKLGPHVAPLGMEFYTGSMFPEEYRNQAFIAEHGSWNRRDKIGYRVKLVRVSDEGYTVGDDVFAEGWLQGQEEWGRPVDLETMPDGSLLLSDDEAGVVYRITYSE